jgi:hypothetical protein
MPNGDSSVSGHRFEAAQCGPELGHLRERHGRRLRAPHELRTPRAVLVEPVLQAVRHDDHHL